MSDTHLERNLHIAELLKKSILDDLSTEEWETLEAWKQEQEENQALFNTLEQGTLAEDLFKADTCDFEAATDRIFAATGLNKKPEPSNVPVIRLIAASWWKIAAASLVITTAGWSWYHFNALESERKEAQHAHSKVVPGGNRALLELSDGRKVELEAASNGWMSREGDSKIIKLEDGRLTYQSAPTPSTQKPVYNTLSTPRGGQYQLILPDGTSVWLNSASSITFPNYFDGNERRVRITGEAYFEVKSMPSQKQQRNIPFVVEAGNERIKVLGTHFNVNAYGDEGCILTTLIEGSVNVGNAVDSVTLQPGQQSKIVKGATNYKIDRPDLEEVLAWKNGNFLFNHASTKSMMTQLSRWYDIDIHYMDNVEGIYFSGGLSRKDRLEKMIELLELDGRLSLKLNGNVLNVMLKKTRRNN